MPVWVFVDILIGLCVVVDIFIRSKGFLATQLRLLAEFVMSLAFWRQS